MAKVISSGGSRIEKNISRPGVHAKTKMSKNKNSKNYKKLYRGQGR